VQARPSLIARLRKADLLICTGADLEVGWLPVLLRRASNAGVQPGQPGYQACLRPRERFWDIPVPKIDSAFDNLLVPQPSWSPSTTQQLRKLVAAPYLSPNDWTPRSETYFVFPLAQGTPGKQCGLAATGDYQPSLRSPWLAALEAASAVALRDRPARLDRAQGDVHPQGNPHIQTDPHNILKVAKMLSQRLIQLDAENAAFYQQRIAGFSKRWNEALAGWDKRGEKLRGMPIVVQHNGWTYLVHWLGLRQVATLEPKPGVPPRSADLSKVLMQLKSVSAKQSALLHFFDRRVPG
ncbi:metal ABC transporter solute-binding protein, Zn/Mn family, partial [Thiolapillus sp.]